MSPEIKAGLFTYSGAGFLYAGETRCSSATITRRLSNSSQLSVKWLKAQLAHYAIKPLAGTKDELETRLRQALREGKIRAQPIQLKDLERGLRVVHEARPGRRTAGKAKRATNRKSAAMPLRPTKVGGNPPMAKKMVPAAATPEQTDASAMSSKSPRRPAESFADKVLGTYMLACPTIQSGWPAYCSDGNMYVQVFRDVRDPVGGIVAEFDLGLVQGLAKLDWIPACKRSRVPFTWSGEVGHERLVQFGENRGEIEFAREGIRIKGSLVGVEPAGEVRWEGRKTSPDPRTREVNWNAYTPAQFERRTQMRWG